MDRRRIVLVLAPVATGLLAPIAASALTLVFAKDFLPTDVADDGTVLVERETGATTAVALWSPGVEGLVPLPGSTGGFQPFRGVAITPDGSAVVGEARSRASRSGFLWTRDGGTQLLPFFPSGISDAGDVIVGGAPPSRSVNGVLEALPGVGRGVAVSGDGRVAFLGGAGAAYRWTEEMGLEPLGFDVNPLGCGTFSSPSGCPAIKSSFDGDVLAGSLPTGVFSTGILWTESGGLMELEFISSSATGVSSDGRLVVGWAATEPAQAAGASFLWDPEHGVRDLRDVLAEEFAEPDAFADYSRVLTYGLSPNGRYLVGEAFRNDDHTVWGWRLDLVGDVVPEPGTGLLLALGLACLAGRRHAADRLPRSLP